MSTATYFRLLFFLAILARIDKVSIQQFSFRKLFLLVHWKLDLIFDGMFLMHEFISKFDSSSFWSISASITAIIASKSSLYRKLVIPEATFMTYLYGYPIRLNMFWNYCKKDLYSQTIFCSYMATKIRNTYQRRYQKLLLYLSLYYKCTLRWRKSSFLFFILTDKNCPLTCD